MPRRLAINGRHFYYRHGNNGTSQTGLAEFGDVWSGNPARCLFLLKCDSHTAAPIVCVLHLDAARVGPVVATGTMWSGNPKIFTLWPFAEKSEPVSVPESL